MGVLFAGAHPDFNTPETTRSGSLGGMPVAVATGRALQRMRLDAKLDPPLSDRHVVMGGVRLTDPLEQRLLDESMIEQVSVDDLRTAGDAVFTQLDRLNAISDRLYVHIDMDVLDPREVMGHGNKVPGGPSSEELARLFEEIFREAGMSRDSRAPELVAPGVVVAARHHDKRSGRRGSLGWVVAVNRILPIRTTFTLQDPPDTLCVPCVSSW